MLAKSRTDSEISRTVWEIASITQIEALHGAGMSSRPAGSQVPR